MIRLIALAMTLWLLIPSIVYAGEIRMYDDNDQYLGILIDYSGPVPSDYEECKIYIPSINSFGMITGTSGSNPGILYSNTIFFKNDDCTGTPYVYNFYSSLQGVVTSDFNGSYKFYKTTKNSSTGPFCSAMSFNGTCSDISPCTTVYTNYELIELPQQDEPFTVPVALPLRFEYVADAPSVPAFSNLGLAILVSLLVVAGAIVMRKKV